jgi:phage-related protein
VATNERPKLAHVSFEGDSRAVLGSWPKAMKIDFGHALREMQQGLAATLEIRPMTSIGPGVFELKDSDDKTWYRMIYLARIDDVIYVLHCFDKDSRKTDRRDINIATKRLANVKQRLMEERRNAKLKARKSTRTPY